MESSVTCVNEMSLNRWQMTRTFVGRKVKCMTNQRRKQKIKPHVLAGAKKSQIEKQQKDNLADSKFEVAVILKLPKILLDNRKLM